MFPRTRGPSMKPVCAATKEDRALGDQDDPEEPHAQREAADLPGPDERFDERGVQGLAGDVLNVGQQIAEEQAAGGEGQRGGHQGHGLLPRLHLGRAQDLQPVRDGLDARVRAGPEAVTPQQDEGHGPEAELLDPLARLADRVDEQRRRRRDVGEDPIEDEAHMGDEEEEKDRRQGGHRFLHAPEVEQDEAERDEQDKGQLVLEVARRQEAQHGLDAARDGDADRQHVVDDQGAARDEPEGRSEELRGHDVAAAAGREELDDLGIARRDGDDRERGHDGQVERQVTVVAERQEGLRRAVVRRAQPVRAQPDPGEEGDERQPVEDPRVADVLLPAEDDLLESVPGRHITPPAWSGARRET